MGASAFKVLYLLAMVAVVVGVDFMFLRHLFWGLRLAVNVGIVAVFLIGYFFLMNRLWERPEIPGYGR